MQTQIRRRSMACALAGTIALLSAGLAAGPATAARPDSGTKLTCFEGRTGTCTLDASRTTATLANGPYSGVTFSSPVGGKTLSRISALEFTYDGDAPGAGAPRFSLPVDTDGDGVTDAHVFIAAYYCNDDAGHVDAINDPTCTMQLGGETFENWDALLTAHPDYIAGDPVIVADETGTWTISDVRATISKVKS
jgi:hypothetical protein